jgi:nitroimidazol reductase NimA-like FMN-containing flavoprotein (pyridoxamine 5'-phosphate oxidase superfamily)
MSIRVNGLRRGVAVGESASIPDAVISGHRRILEALHEFRGGAERTPEGRCTDRETVLGLVAFLRQEILPFAAREEQGLAADQAEYETTSFEHAFLAAEIDALAGAVQQAASFANPAWYETGIVRRIHRIEAVLELHVARHEDRYRDLRGSPIREPAADSSPAYGQGVGASRTLADAEIEALLRRNWWAVLSTAAAGQPYAVPVAYGMDNGSFCVASRDGQKLRNLQANPLVCLTVLEVESGCDWGSVVVMGRAEPIEGALGTFGALRALRRQCHVPPSPVATRAARLFGAKFIRIVPAVVTGRTRAPQRDGD